MTSQQATSIWAQQPDVAQPQPEFILGRYRIVQSCGTGGFGDVMLCWDVRLQRRVAIKTIPLRIEQSGHLTSTVGDALQEARTSSLLAHPNIVTVYDFEADDNYAYLVMEYVDGVNLADLLARVEGGTLTGDEAAHVLQSVGRALQHAHENGVLHLDVKPSNVMIDRRGTVKIGDFGMATLASAAGYGGARGGTVGYMSPEQVQGYTVDERSDVFSLAVVIWQALCGTCPFAAVSPEESVSKIQAGPRQTLEAVGVRPAAELALTRAITPSAAERTSSVQELVDQAIPQLGDPDEGQASIAYLLSQLDDEKSEDEVRHELGSPLLERAPWLSGVVARGTTALCTAVVTFGAVATIVDDARIRLAVCAVAAVLAAIWQPLGAALAACAVIAAIGIVGELTSAFPLALLVGILLACWWVAYGRRHRATTVALLLPSVVGTWSAAAAPAAFGLGAWGALVTSGLSALLANTYMAGVGCSFDAASMLPRLGAELSQPAWWAGVGIAMLAATAGAALTRHGGSGWGVAGQVVACVGTISALVVQRHMENGGIWAVPAMSSIVVAVGLCVLLCIATVLAGQVAPDQEADDQ